LERIISPVTRRWVALASNHPHHHGVDPLAGGSSRKVGFRRLQHGGKRPLEPRVGHRVDVAELGEHVDKIHAAPLCDFAQAKALPALLLGEVDRGIDDPVA
jgi:hypothetical protein